jgi:uncharacterized protein (DUF58 family)
LAVRQFEQQRRFDTCILLDAYMGTGDDPDLVETAISLAATFVVHLVGSPTDQVVLAVGGSEAAAVFGGGLDRGKRSMLEVLCQTVASETPRTGEAAEKAIRMVGYSEELIVISPRSSSAARRDQPELFRGLGTWLRRGALRWIDVSQDLQHWAVPELAQAGRGTNPADGKPKRPARAPDVPTVQSSEGG